MKQCRGKVGAKWVWDDYMPIPAALSIHVESSLAQKAAAIVGWKAKIGKAGYSGSGASDLYDFLEEQSKRLGKRKMIFFTPDLSLYYHFLKKKVDDFFEVACRGKAYLRIGQIELRDPKYVFADWEMCSDAKLEIEQLIDFADFFYTCIADKTHVPLTTQQVVKHMLKSRMTVADKLLVYNLAPSTKEGYDYVMAHLFIGAYCDAVHTEPLEEMLGHVDFVTSYAARMLFDYFPMSKFEQWPIEDLDKALRTKCCQIEATLYGVKAKTIRFLSKKRVVSYEGAEIDKIGRIKKADKLQVCLTELDFDLLRKCYDFDSITIDDLWVADRGELPEYVRSVAEELYAQKASSPKGTVARAWAKIQTEMLFGGSVKAIYTEKGESWHDVRMKKMYMSPYWGIWCISHARYALLTVAMMLGEDFVYSDTDSLYFRHPLFHIQTIEKYNAIQRDKAFRYCTEHGLDYETYKDLGSFGYEDGSDAEKPTIVRFTALGPKRYIYTFLEEGERKVVVKIAGYAKQYDKDGKVVSAWEYHFPDEDELYLHFHDDFKIQDIQQVVQSHDDETCMLIYKGKGYVSDSYALVYGIKTHTSVHDRYMEMAEAEAIIQGKQYEAGKEERVQLI